MGNAMSDLKFVFCEGGDDFEVISRVATSIGLNVIRVEPFLGKNKLREFLRAFKTRPELTRNEIASIGIVRDADDDGNAAFQSVRDALLANGFKAPDQNGGFAVNGIKTGILIVGPNDGRGMVEDLCLNSVSGRPEFPCVDEYFRCIAQKSNRNQFSSKAKIRVWMASHVDYDLRVGKAAAAGYWPWESAAFNPIKEFLRQL
jgi:hypothetical protein